MGDDFDTGKLTGVKSKDLHRALPGDLLKVEHREHEAATGFKAGQHSDQGQQGQGGNRVWRETFTPSEKAVLQKFFE